MYLPYGSSILVSKRKVPEATELTSDLARKGTD